MSLTRRPSFALALGTIPVLVQRCEDPWAQPSQPVLASPFLSSPASVHL